MSTLLSDNISVLCFQTNLQTLQLFTPRFASLFFGRKTRDRSLDLKDIEIGCQAPIDETPSTVVSPPRKLSPSVTCSSRRVAPRQVWVESLDSGKERYLDIIDLHPDIFAILPRLDLVHLNLYWQAHYRMVVRIYSYLSFSISIANLWKVCFFRYYCRTGGV